MSPRRAFLIRLAPVAAWMAFIFAMSTDRGSAEHSRPMVYAVLHAIAPSFADSLPLATLERIDWDIRKIGHVSEYTALSLLVWRLVRWRERRFVYSDLVWTLLVTIGYSVSDEWHQSFIPSRGAAAADVVFDAFGACIGACLSMARMLKTNQAESDRSRPVG